MDNYLKKNIYTFVLLFFLIVCGFLRFYNLNWDQGFFFHPDERNIANAVVKIHFFDNLNPEFFAYGGFSIYLYRVAANAMAAVTHSPEWVSDWGKIDLVGRFFSAFFSSITLLPLFLLAKKMFNKQIGLLSAAVYTFCVTSIQLAHFGVTESLFVLTGVIICLLALKIREKANAWSYILCGMFCGLAAATKTTELAFLVFPCIAFLINVTKIRGNWRHILIQTGIYMFFFVLLFVSGFIVFCIFSPYTFLSWDKFIESMRYESGVATGTLPVVYTYQFNTTLPYLFQIKNFFWQLGPIIVFSMAGIPLLLYKMVKKRNGKLLIFLSFPIIYFLYVGLWHTKFIRYMAPISPYLIISACYLLFVIQKKFKVFGSIVLGISIFLTAFWALAFFSIYTREQTRIAASKWMYSNFNPGVKILGEHWDDGLPIPIPGFNPGLFTIEQLTIYEQDNQEKLLYYGDKLSQADYIVINSRRLYGTLMHLTKQYPLTSTYYKLLFNGNLGYEKIAEFSSYPSLFGLTIIDDASEETFQVYDHPKVLIFKNILHLSSHDIMRILVGS